MAIITVSRGTYSGGKAVAEKLHERLGYRLLSREQLLTDAADTYGASKDELESALLHSPRFLERRRMGRVHYIHSVQAALAKEVQSDNVVYHGQAGHLLLHGIPHHLRLRIVADMEYRIAAARRRSNLTREKAIKLIQELDQEREEWVRRMYGVRRNDPATYDLEINLERISIPSVCEMVAEMVALDFPTTQESRQLLDDLVLASDVRARIGLDPYISDERIEVEAVEGVVTITGTVHTKGDIRRVEVLAAQIPGPKRIDCKLGVHW